MLWSREYEGTESEKYLGDTWWESGIPVFNYQRGYTLSRSKQIQLTMFEKYFMRYSGSLMTRTETMIMVKWYRGSRQLSAGRDGCEIRAPGSDWIMEKLCFPSFTIKVILGRHLDLQGRQRQGEGAKGGCMCRGPGQGELHRVQNPCRATTPCRGPSHFSAVSPVHPLKII